MILQLGWERVREDWRWLHSRFSSLNISLEMFQYLDAKGLELGVAALNSAAFTSWNVEAVRWLWNAKGLALFGDPSVGRPLTINQHDEPLSTKQKAVLEFLLDVIFDNSRHGWSRLNQFLAWPLEGGATNVLEFLLAAKSDLGNSIREFMESPSFPGRTLTWAIQHGFLRICDIVLSRDMVSDLDFVDAIARFGTEPDRAKLKEFGIPCFLMATTSNPSRLARILLQIFTPSELWSGLLKYPSESKHKFQVFHPIRWLLAKGIFPPADVLPLLCYTAPPAIKLFNVSSLAPLLAVLLDRASEFMEPEAVDTVLRRLRPSGREAVARGKSRRVFPLSWLEEPMTIHTNARHLRLRETLL